MYKSQFTKKASKQLRNFGNDQKIVKEVKALEKDPYKSNVTKLKNKTLPGAFRARRDPYRIIFTIDKKNKLIIIESIMPRDKIYKKR